MSVAGGARAVAPARGLARDALLDVGGTAALLLTAAVARYPNLWVAPRFRDETFEALRALAIYRGQLAPLTNIEPYIGSFFNYAVAAAFVALGPTIYVPRLVVTAFGIATVGATYFLGREVAGRAVGLIAAAFLLTNGVHIAAIGHMGFSADIAPFFTTIGFWLLHRAVARGAPWSLALAGLSFGMGLHTHPTTVAFLPGALGWFLWNRSRWLRTPWPYVAALLFLLAYSPMIIFNVQTGGESVRHAVYTATERPDYARSRDTSLTPESYVSRQRDYWMMSYQTLGGALDARSDDADYLTDPSLLGFAALAIAGVGWAARRGYSLPLWAIVSVSLILPLFNATHYDVVGDGHYVAKALPLIYASIGLLAVDLVRGARQRLGPRQAGVVAAGVAALVVALAASQLLALERYYSRASRADPTNASLIRAMDNLKANRHAGEVVLLDDNLNDRRVDYASPWDEASTFRVFRFIMEFDEIPYEVAGIDEQALTALAGHGQPAIVILAAGRDSKDTENLAELVDRFGLRGLDGRSARPPRPVERYGMYRLDPSAVAARAAQR